jgi:hypothetical protein
MALSINTTVTTNEGFEIPSAFCYINIFILNPQSNWCSLMYFKSEADFTNGKNPLNVVDVPTQVQTELTSEEFWGDTLALLIHNRCKAAIEEVTGAETVTIIL